MVKNTPFLSCKVGIIDPKIKDALIYGLLIAVLIIGVYELSDSKNHFWPGPVLALLAIGFNAFDFPANNTGIFSLKH